MPARFLVDVMCGRIVPYLRMCGYDTVYAGDVGIEADDEIVAAAQDDGRTILTRDVALANRAAAAILLESRETDAQLAELHEAGVELSVSDVPTRCGACNGPLERVAEGTPPPGYAPDPDEVPCWRCRQCGQWFWRGSHWDRVRERLSRVQATTSDPGSDDQ